MIDVSWYIFTNDNKKYTFEKKKKYTSEYLN